MIKRLIKPFPLQIESQTGASREYISTQQMLLHSTALDQLEKACIQSLNGLITQGFNIFEIAEPLNDFLASFNASKHNQNSLDFFFENHSSFKNITNLIESRVVTVLTATNTAFLGAVWSYYEKTLSAETKLKLRKADNWDSLVKPDRSVHYPLITVYGQNSTTNSFFDYAAKIHKRYVNILLAIGDQIEANTLFNQGSFQSYQLVLKTQNDGEIMLHEQEKEQLMFIRKSFAFYLLRRLKTQCNELVSLENQNDIFFSFYKLSEKIESLGQKGVKELNLEALNKLLSEVQLDFTFDSYRLSRNLPQPIDLNNVFVPLSNGCLDYHVLLTNFSQFRELFKQDDLLHYFAPEGNGNFFTARETPCDKLTGSVAELSLIQPVGLIS